MNYQWSSEDGIPSDLRVGQQYRVHEHTTVVLLRGQIVRLDFLYVPGAVWEGHAVVSQGDEKFTVMAADLLEIT